MKLLILIFFSLNLFASSNSSTCQDGECIPEMVDKLASLQKLFQEQCVPKEVLGNELENHFLEKGIDENCYRLLSQYKSLEATLQSHLDRLQERLGCDSKECLEINSTYHTVNSQLNELSHVKSNLQCSEEEKKKIKVDCIGDIGCALYSSALGVGGYVAERLVPTKFKPTGCHLGNDSCVSQLAQGFIQATMTLFDSLWGLVKVLGKGVKNQLNKFWNWVSGTEDHSSTAQLSMAKASENEGVFQMLVNDFSGTMSKMWQALIGSLKEWMKNDVFCQQWSGVAHFSQCLKPAQNFDCTSCKTFINGICMMSGVIAAEVIPAFLTGGMVSAAKYGAQAAGKIAKGIKVSSTTLKTIKNSKFGKQIVLQTNKLDDALKLSQGLIKAKEAIKLGISLGQKYVFGPANKMMKNTLNTISSLVTKYPNLYVAYDGTKKIIVFSGKTLKTTTKVIFYPIENPMTVKAFNLGVSSFDKFFKLGAPKLFSTTGVTAKILSESSHAEEILSKMEALRLSKNHSGDDLMKLQVELIEVLGEKRKALLLKSLKGGEPLDESIKLLYPEIINSELLHKLQVKNLNQIHEEILALIKTLPEEKIRNNVTQEFLDNYSISSKIKIQPVSPQIVLRNASLDMEKRVEEMFSLIKRKPSSIEEQSKLAQSLEESHLLGKQAGVYEYSWRELRHKHEILLKGGFTPEEADLLIRHGLAGRPPVRELIIPDKTLFHGFASDIVDGRYLDKRSELSQLIEAMPDETSGIDLIRKKFFEIIGKKTESNVKDNIEALYFIDYSHSTKTLDSYLWGTEKIQDSKLSLIYSEKAFSNFKDTRNFLLKERPPVNKETLLLIHKKMMVDGVENVRAGELGLIRDGNWYGGVSSSNPISKKIKEEILSNPYLTWIEDGIAEGDQYFGKIMYPHPHHMNDELSQIIKRRNPELLNEINKINKNNERTPISVDELTRNLVEELVDDLFEKFDKEKELLGKIDTPEKLDTYVDLIAKFQRDLVSIHPLSNGNGRSTRELMNYMLMKEGFPPARILDVNADIYRSLDEWKLIVKHGILSSDFLMDDLLERLKFGLPIENSIELITPYTRPPTRMLLKGEKGVSHIEGVEYIDPRLYRELLKEIQKKEPAIKNIINKNPVEGWDFIDSKIDDIFAKNNIYYKHPKKGIERVEIGFVDNDFKILFGQASYKDPELYNFKMKSWYSNDINWRGLASKNKLANEDDIIKMFKELNSHMASNSVLNKVGSSSNPDIIRKAALEDFEKFNSDVMGDGLVKMARDHSETGPLYGVSYGYSTSKNREVGKAFAMGALVVGEYGAHRAPELQALLKSRILVGAKKSIKDVDLGRLKQVRPDFSYKYGRQQEVMGIGASDPDAISIIQTIDAEGDVILSYLRNPNKPNEVWVVKGHIEVDAIPQNDQILKIIDLN